MSMVSLVLHGGYTPPPPVSVLTHKVFRDTEREDLQCLSISETKEKRIRDAFNFIRQGIDTYDELEDCMNCSTSTVKEATRRLFSVGAIYKEVVGRTHFIRANMDFNIESSLLEKMESSKPDLSIYESEHEYRRHLLSGDKTPEQLSILLNNHKTSVYRFLKKLKQRGKAIGIEKLDIPGKNGSVLWRWIGE